MASRRTIKIVLIGSGNVATHLGQALARHHKIAQVFSRNIENARQLAAMTACNNATDDLTELISDADLYLISVTDDAIEGILDATEKINSGIWAHTSGSTPMCIFTGKKKRFGVFYPLQTFSKMKEVDVNRVSMLIEGCNDEVTEELKAVAKSISTEVSLVDSKGRADLHVAAVFACNFVNYMWVMADELLQKHNLNISAMMPLLEETLNKLKEMSPEAAQTGPARRGDTKVIDRHLQSLAGAPREVYKLVSDLILKHYHSHE